ncbi:MalY/PatB family protein [Oceanirhabdus seepicola]|uniref:cysteine-S-conjugate beta-lyase n=1 Tax=Oceanirhabdus seepicola TaxID=2828781 RepID=A0A9J6P486_9CLOT|nr:MalY/PatB family protein [Oceanirhabdus seepicola]MCM1991363.1 pyridoxal phosphate-dependent aminotransferase [Oceanirhabdus seepicola]
MKNSFDRLIDRRIVPTEKWSKEKLNEYFGSSEVLPLWVADMDFEVSNTLVEDLKERAEHGVFGYEYKSNRHHQALIEWYEKRHNWKINIHHIHYAPSVLTAISILIETLTNEGDQIIIQPPVYYPFSKIIKSHNRKVVKNSLRLVGKKYSIDFDDLEEKAKDPKTKLILLSNPHNPVGRVWSRDELRRIGEISIKYGLMIISDEIHGDIVFNGYNYTPMSTVSNEIMDRTITCLSPGKTFNISSLSTAAVIISNKMVAEKYQDLINKYHLNHTNAFSAVAFESVYKNGEAWFNELMIYLEENYYFLEKYFEIKLPNAKVIKTEGTYLAWIDLRYLNLDAKELQRFIIEEAKLAFDFGHWFGREGAGFVRVNMACPRMILKKALNQLKEAIESK